MMILQDIFRVTSSSETHFHILTILAMVPCQQRAVDFWPLMYVAVRNLLLL